MTTWEISIDLRIKHESETADEAIRTILAMIGEDLHPHVERFLVREERE